MSGFLPVHVFPTHLHADEIKNSLYWCDSPCQEQKLRETDDAHSSNVFAYSFLSRQVLYTATISLCKVGAQVCASSQSRKPQRFVLQSVEAARNAC